MLEPSISMITSTGHRIFRMQGLPWKTSGSIVILSKRLTVISFTSKIPNYLKQSNIPLVNYKAQKKRNLMRFKGYASTETISAPFTNIWLMASVCSAAGMYSLFMYVRKLGYFIFFRTAHHHRRPGCSCYCQRPRLPMGGFW